MADDQIDGNFSDPFNETSQPGENFLNGLTGLWNLGNTCYMNSALQALSNCPQFREYFRSFLANDEGFVQEEDALVTHGPHPVSTAFVDLMSRVWADGSNKTVAPTLLLMKIREKCTQFRSYAQQDSQELRRPVKKWELDFAEACRSGASRNGVAAVNGPSASSSSSSGTAPGTATRTAEASSSQSNARDNENFETADSGLSSDTEDSSTKTSSDYNGDRKESDEREKIVRYRSIVSDVFDGELVSSVKCQTCQHISYTTENFQDISLSIPTSGQLDYRREPPSFFSSKSSPSQPSLSADAVARPKSTTTQLLRANYGYVYWLLALATRWLLGPWVGFFSSFYRYWFNSPVTLEHCLKTFFSMDYLHGDDMYSCDRCAKLRNGVKQCALTELPEILCIHLKRFRHDNTYNAKVNTRVHFPLTDLDLRPFMRESESGERVTKYDLVAIVSHRGGSVDHGHYVAYCRNDLDKNWYEFDDKRVTRANGLDVMNREAYMLFYQKKTPKELVEARQHVLNLLPDQEEANTDGAHVDDDRFYVSKEWLYRFLTFAEPGHINNCDFLCSHGHLVPAVDTSFSQRLVHYMSGELWTFLREKMAGGGPECRQLIECGKCRRAQDRLLKRKHFERATFEDLELDSSHDDDVMRFPPNAISSHWLEKWNSFVRQPNAEPPPAINNEALVKRYKDGMRLRNGARYAKIRRKSWLFFHSIYGGGPELFAIPFMQPSPEEIAEYVATEHRQRTEAICRQMDVECESAGDDAESDVKMPEYLENAFATGDGDAADEAIKKTDVENPEKLKVIECKAQIGTDSEYELKVNDEHETDMEMEVKLLSDVPVPLSENPKTKKPSETTNLEPSVNENNTELIAVDSEHSMEDSADTDVESSLTIDNTISAEEEDEEQNFNEPHENHENQTPDVINELYRPIRTVDPTF